MAKSGDARLERVRAAKPVAERVFGALLGEVAVGITRVGDAYGLKVNVAAPLPAGQSVPADIQGIPVRVEVTGPIRKRPGPGLG